MPATERKEMDMPDDHDPAELFKLCQTMPAEEQALLLRIVRADPRLRPYALMMSVRTMDWVQDMVTLGTPLITPIR
jgi:hypothetical protein